MRVAWVSAKLTPAAGDVDQDLAVAGHRDRARSTCSSTSGPPNSSIWIAFIAASRPQSSQRRAARTLPVADVAAPSSDRSPSTPSRPRSASASGCSAAPPSTSRWPRASSPRCAPVGPVGDDFGAERVRGAARAAAIDHRRHRARRRAASRSSGAATTSTTSTSPTPRTPSSASSATSSRSSPTPRRAADVALPRQHPARPPAPGPRPVRATPASARLDSMNLWIDTAQRLAAGGDRRGRLRDRQRRRDPPADRRAEPRPRRPRGDGAWARARSSPSRASTAPRCSPRTASSPCPASRSRTSRDPTGAGDSFAGGFLGYLDGHDGELDDDLPAAGDGLRHGARLVQRRGVRHRAGRRG